MYASKWSLFNKKNYLDYIIIRIILEYLKLFNCEQIIFIR